MVYISQRVIYFFDFGRSEVSFFEVIFRLDFVDNEYLRIFEVICVL